MSAVVGIARVACAVTARLEAVLGPWLALAIRLWLAQTFVMAEVRGMMTGAGLSSLLGPAWWQGVVDAVVGSHLGVAVQSICPILLALGLGCRPAAFALLLQTVLLVTPGVGAGTQLCSAALLLRLVVAGPGPLALDGLLRRGAESIALPGVATAQRAFAWTRRALGPVYQCALRLWLAAATAGVALAALAITNAMQPGIAWWLPRLPSMVVALAPALAAMAAVLLLLGAGVRIVGAVLLAVVPVSQLVPGDGRLYWALLLALLVVHGAGRWSIDGWLAARLRRMAAAPDLEALPHVVVVGGGFGGIAAVRGLRGAPCRVTLIDQRNHHLFQPLLYQVATASLSPGDIATPVRAMVRDQLNVRVLLGQVTGVDTVQRAVLLERGGVGYDYLVLATGAQHSYFGRDDWAPYAPGLKTIEDGTAIRRRLLLAFEEAENAETAAERAAWLTFAVVGGGPTGVELAGAIAELARYGMEQEFRRIDPAAARVLLIQSGPRLLPAFPEALSREAERALRDLGVEILLDCRVEAVSAAGATVAGALFPARTVLWAAGVLASPAARWLGVAADRAGRVPVGADLAVPGRGNVFAIGDTAASNGWSGQPVPGLAPAAKQGGAYVARVIRARLLGRTPPAPFRYRHFGSLATIGRKSAVADFGFVRLRGALAWWLWGAAHIAFLVGGRNRVSVLVEWFWAYLTFRRGTRLITESR